MVLKSNRMFCRIKDVNNFTCNICFSEICVFICVFPHRFSSLCSYFSCNISVYTVLFLMHKQRWASGGKIWKQETIGAVWLSEWPILLEHRRDASLHQTHQRAENLSHHFFLSFWPSSLHYAVCLFFYVCLHHPLTPSPGSYFLLPLLAAVNQDFYPQFSLLCGCA